MKVLFVWPNKDAFGFKPIGISLLSGIARQLGWDVRLFDTTEIDFGFVNVNLSGESAKIFKPIDFSRYGLQKCTFDLESKFSRFLKEYNPDCLAFSVLSDEHVIAARISEIAKKISPDIPIIWGGKYPTLNPEKTMKIYAVDFVCIGEGLDAFSTFLQALENNNNIHNIPNIWAKKKKDLVKNAIRPLRNNLDNLPYVDWEIFDKRQFFKPFDGNIFIGGDHMLNWGCPHHCTYCINHFYHEMYNNKYFMRRYGIKRIITELKSLKIQYNLEFFRFHDEDFLMRPLKNLQKLSAAYKKEVNLPFTIETNPKSVTSEKVKLLKEMNCASASLGIETGDKNLRKMLKRKDTEEDIIRAFSLLKDAGIRTSAFYMLGIPFETRNTYTKTIELSKKANVQYPCPGFFYPFEGTKLREIAIKEGYFYPENNKKMIFERDKPALHFNDFSETELIEMRKVFVLYAKLPEQYKPYIRRSEKLDDVGKKIRRKLIEIYDKTVWKNNGFFIDDGQTEKNIEELNKLL